MTCSAAMRRTGPLSALHRPIFDDSGFLSCSAVRVTEMAFCTNDTWPASMARLFDDGSQVKTSDVCDSVCSAFMYFSASMVSLELMVTLPLSSCSAPPNDQRR